MGDRRRNVVLTGFMGTGKTTVGRELARRLDMRFVDTDHLIEERHGPIPDIFDEFGEDTFRSMEREVAAELAALDGLVVATGGRLMLDPVNAELLAATGDVFCLAADVDEIVRRVTRRRTARRPLLSGDDPAGRVAALLAERAEGYGRFEQVATGGRPPRRIALEIARRLADRAG